MSHDEALTRSSNKLLPQDLAEYCRPLRYVIEHMRKQLIAKMLCLSSETFVRSC